MQPLKSAAPAEALIALRRGGKMEQVWRLDGKRSHCAIPSARQAFLPSYLLSSARFRFLLYPDF
jgi:hypothetical protein